MTVLLGGTWGGVDAAEAARVTIGEAAAEHWPVLPELPERGPGADAVGRTAALLPELAVDLQPHGWRIAPSSAGLGVDRRRAVSYLAEDLHRWADVAGAEGLAVDRLALRVHGPLSLLAGLWLPGGERVLVDAGARRDVVDALAEALASLMRRVREQTEARHIGLVLDEPRAAAAQAGTLPTASGYRTVRALPRDEARRHWSRVLEALDGSADCVWLNAEPRPVSAERSGAFLAGEDGDAVRRAARRLRELAVELVDAALAVTACLRLGRVDGEAAASVWGLAAAASERGAPERAPVAVGTDLAPETLLHEAERVGVDPALLARWDLIGPGTLDGEATVAGLRGAVAHRTELIDRLAEVG